MRFMAVLFVSVAILSPEFLDAGASEDGVRLEVLPLDSADAPATVRVSGTVVSVSGAPMEDVAIRWWEQERPGGLWPVDAPPAAQTASDGSYTVELPGLPVHYMLEFDSVGFTPVQIPFFGDGPVPPVSMVPLPLEEGETGMVTRDGQPARATVHLVAYGWPRAAIETDEKGTFQLPDMPESRRPSYAYATSDGEFSPFQYVAVRPKSALALGSPGRLEGTVVRGDSDEPVPGCTVGFHLGNGAVSLETTTSDEQGRFRSGPLPPGTYGVSVTHDDYGELTGADFKPERPLVSVVAGETVDYRAAVFPKAVVSGRVIHGDGTPAAGAWIGFESTPFSSTWPLFRQRHLRALRVTPVRADGQGNFRLETRHTDRSVKFQAYHPAGGIAEESIRVPGPGEENGDLQVVLSGAMRVRGTVRNTLGEPVAGVAVGTLTADGEGRFDSGFAAIPTLEKGALELDFLAPRPSFDGQLPPTIPVRKDGHPVLYLHRTVTLEPKPGQDFVVNLTLESTRAIMLTGMVTDHEGRPVPDAEITRMMEDFYQQPLYPKTRPYGSIFHSFTPPNHRPTEPGLNRVVSDASGAWSLVLPVETPPSMRAAYRTPAVYAPTTLRAIQRARGLATTVNLPDLATLQDRYTITIVFPEDRDASDAFYRAVVVDTSGQPLDGIAWQTSLTGAKEDFLTDEEGNLRVLRGPGRRVLTLADTDWNILAPPEFSGGQSIDFKFIKGAPPYKIVLGRQGNLKFHVHYPDGEGAKAMVGLYETRLDVAYGDEPGLFEVKNLPAGPLTLTLFTRDGYRRPLNVYVPSGGTGVENHVIPRPTGTITGRLRDATGLTHSGLYVRITGDNFRYSVTSDGDGAFTFSAPPGFYTLEVQRDHIPCLAGTYGETVEVGSDGAHRELDLLVTTPAGSEAASNLARIATLTVRALSGDDQPAAGLLLSAALSTNDTVKLSGITDPSGYHTFTGMYAGLYRLTIQPQGGAGPTREYLIPVEPGATAEYIIELYGGATVAGVVSGPANTSEFRLRYWSPASGISVSGRATAHGDFQLPHIPPGPGTLYYEHGASGTRGELHLHAREAMEPVRIDLAGGAIVGELPRHLAMIAQRGAMEIIPLQPTGAFPRCDFNGLEFRAEMLRDGDYELRVKHNGKIVARSAPITIANGATVREVVWQIDEKALPPDPRNVLFGQPR